MRSDKKFLVKVWVPIQNKSIFRRECMRHHLSMMFVGEKYLTKSLDKYSDEKISLLIEDRLPVYNNMNNSIVKFEPLGIRITNDYWQKIAWFADTYYTSVAKIGSVIFENALGTYEMKEVFEEYGLGSNNKRKVFSGVTLEESHERLSDYYG